MSLSHIPEHIYRKYGHLAIYLTKRYRFKLKSFKNQFAVCPWISFGTLTRKLERIHLEVWLWPYLRCILQISGALHLISLIKADVNELWRLRGQKHAKFSVW